MLNEELKIPVLLFGMLITLYSCNSIKKITVTTEPGKKKIYTLVWAEEFSKDGRPDTSGWRYEKSFIRNEELQWYQTENAKSEKGLLIIEGRRQTKPNPLYEAGSNDWRRKRENIGYTSASINTSGKHSWKYGRFVMRGKIDISRGLWPAWWTLGVDGHWPANGEIDIMEYYKDGSNINPFKQPHYMLLNLAIGGTGGGDPGDTKFPARFEVDYVRVYQQQ